MFSTEPRCIYRSNQLAQVICQLRFPKVDAIESRLPADFQEAIRAEFPQFSARKELPAPKIINSGGNMSLEKPESVTNYQFSSADGIWRVNLTSGFISLACTRYTCWEDFARKLDKPLAAFIQIYKIAYFERVGLRYLNFISRNALSLTGTPYAELFEPAYLGILSDEAVSEGSAIRSGVDAELNLRGGCRVKLHAGPAMVQTNGKPDPEVKFIFDQDLYMAGKVPVNVSAGALETLHRQAFSIFRGAITSTLHNALDPEII